MARILDSVVRHDINSETAATSFYIRMLGKTYDIAFDRNFFSYFQSVAFKVFARSARVKSDEYVDILTALFVARNPGVSCSRANYFHGRTQISACDSAFCSGNHLLGNSVQTLTFAS